MKKNWNNPKLSNLSLGRTNEEVTTIPIYTIACSCCGKPFYYDGTFGEDGTKYEDFEEANQACIAHEWEVHGGPGCSA